MHRRIDTATLFERLFQTYAAQFTLIFPAALLVFVPVAVLSAAIDADELTLRLLLQLVAVAATYLVQGMVVEAVRDIQDGVRDFTIGGLFRSVLPVLGSLVLAGVLAGIGISLGLFLLIVPGLFLLTIWAVFAPVIVIERVPALRAFGRSRELVRGNGWQVFGIIVTVFLIQIVAGLLLGVLLGSADSRIGAAIATLVSNALIAPLSAIAAALIYLELSGGRGVAPEAPGAAAAPAGPEDPHPAA